MSDNSVIEQIYDDFKYGKSNFDVALKDACQDLSEHMSEAKANAKKQHKRFSQFEETKSLSDSISSWLAEFSDKIAQGFNESSPKSRQELTPKLADICLSIMEIRPASTGSVKKAIDAIVSGYDKVSDQSAEIYKTFAKVYGNAFAQTGKKEYASTANRMSDKAEIINGSITPETSLLRMIEKPTPENLETFKMSWKFELEGNPEKTADNVLSYAKMIHKVPNKAIKEAAFALVTLSLKSALEKEYEATPEKREDIEKSMINVLDIEELVGLKEQADKYRTPFETDMLAIRKKRDNKLSLDKRIHTLLNIPSKKLQVERVEGKTYYPTKAEMGKVANLLVQYSQVDYDIISKIMGKLDTENFTNVDDNIIDKLSKQVARMPKEKKIDMETMKEVEEKLTGIRTKMHKQEVKQKKAESYRTGIITEQRKEKSVADKDDKAPKSSNVYKIKDLKDGGMVK